MKGWEVIKALEEGKTLIATFRQTGDGFLYKMIDGKLHTELFDGKWKESTVAANLLLFENKCDWREYKEPFKIYDWVINIENGETFKIDHIVDGQYAEEFSFTDPIKYPLQYLRHATQEEIKQEKERRKWDLIGRKPNEYKIGDIITEKRDPCAGWFVEDVGEDYILDNDMDKFQLKDIYLICPVENRFDK